MMTNQPDIIDGTIVIGNPATIVETPTDVMNDLAAMQADLISEKTRRRFKYGDGKSVAVEQGKYAFVLVGIADEPVTPEQFFAMSALIAQSVPNIKGVGTVRQDFVPIIADDYMPAIAGELRLEYEKNEPVNQPDDEI